MSLINEMKKVILHIGLPKTATTLLQQHVFAKLNQKIDYIGIKHPREQEQEPLFVKIWQSVCSEQSEFNQNIDALRDCIKSRLHMNNKPFVLSEECFCLDIGKTSWQEKLNRLASVFNEHEIQMLVTIRNPVSAIFSYYVETYPLIKSKYPDLISFANKSNLAKIYNYEYLDSVIMNAFGNVKICYVPFELLKNKRFLPEILNLIEINDELELELPNSNSKKKSKKGVEIHYKRNISPYFQFIFKIPILSKIIKLPIIESALQWTLNLIIKLTAPMSSVTIKNPTQEELALLNIKYIKSNSFISTKINYEFEKP
jgi:hypothetical protein